MSSIINHLLEFDCKVGLMKCEDIVKEMNETIEFYHDEVEEYYDREDREYNITMCFRANDDTLKSIKDYLDKHGFKDRYEIYQKS